FGRGFALDGLGLDRLGLRRGPGLGFFRSGPPPAPRRTCLGDVIDQLEVDHLRSVALARADADDPRIAAGPVREARPDLAEELVDHVLRAQELERLAPRVDVAAAAERVHLLGDRPYLLGLRDRRLDP